MTLCVSATGQAMRYAVAEAAGRAESVLHFHFNIFKNFIEKRGENISVFEVPFRSRAKGRNTWLHSDRAFPQRSQ